MCGRFTLRTPAARVAELFDLDQVPILQPRYNIAPTQQVATIRRTLGSSPPAQKREFAMLRWGLIPFWAKDAKFGARAINARSESISDKPTFRDAYKKRRCLVLADGYYEWKKVGKAKQPYLIHFSDDRPFAFAGLWDRWRSSSDELIESCTILTTTASPSLAHLHERMPVILDYENHSPWLDGSMDADALIDCPEPGLLQTPVSPLVNSVKNDTAACLNRE